MPAGTWDQTEGSGLYVPSLNKRRDAEDKLVSVIKLTAELLTKAGPLEPTIAAALAPSVLQLVYHEGITEL